MIEPVAYINKYNRGNDVLAFSQIVAADKYIPLYEKEQFQPRIKMEKDFFAKWEKLYKEFDGKKFRLVLEELETNFEYIDFYKRFAWDAETVSIFARLFYDYNPEKPEQTVEILPETLSSAKWFVTSDQKTPDHKCWWLSSINSINYVPEYILSKEQPLTAIKFDTKEEAEEWCTPITKAVQMFVKKEL